MSSLLLLYFAFVDSRNPIVVDSGVWVPDPSGGFVISVTLHRPLHLQYLPPTPPLARCRGPTLGTGTFGRVTLTFDERT